MAGNGRKLKLVACLLNVSEARCKSTIDSIVNSAIENQDSWLSSFPSGLKCKSTVLNVFSDFEYNRSVITIAAPLQYISQSVYQAFSKAYELIDIRRHEGGHPRLGSVDLIPLHPLSSNVSLDECSDAVHKISKMAKKSYSDFCAFYFGAADTLLHRGLVQRRKEMNWFKKGNKMDLGDLKFDVGDKPSDRNGVTGLGSIPYMMNVNVTIGTTDLNIGNTIASNIRANNRKTGLPGVQSMAFLHEGNIEVACNLDTKDIQVHEDIFYTTPEKLIGTIKALSEEQNVSVLHRTIIGFTPSEAYDLAMNALLKGDPHVYKSRTSVTM